MTPFLAITGFLLFVALSVLVQLAILKWRHEKRVAEQKRRKLEDRRSKTD